MSMKPVDDIEPKEATDAETPVMTVGEQLRSAREARGLSVKDVATKTRQTQAVLTALEAMETDHIAPTILRMQAGSYAEFLGLDRAEIADAYSLSKSALISENMPGEILRHSQQENRRSLWPIAAGAALIIAGCVSFWSVQSIVTAKPQTKIASIKTIVPPASAPKYERPVRTVATPELSIRALTTGWIEVRGSDGTIFRNRNMSAGEVYYPRMGAAWTVTVRNGAAFEWWFGNRRIGLLSEEASPVYSINVDEATARGRNQMSPELAYVRPVSGQRR